MSRMSIHGSEYPIKKIFSDDFFFTIPRYQRSYSWTTEQSEELYQDLTRVVHNFNGSVEEFAPYFLGSILLIKGEDPHAEIIDGQQRLTTLTMLPAAIRSLMRSDFAEGITGFLTEKGNIITNTPKRYRLQLRELDREFFQRNIQDENGIEELKKLNSEGLSESQKNIRENTSSPSGPHPIADGDSSSLLRKYTIGTSTALVTSSCSRAAKTSAPKTTISTSKKRNTSSPTNSLRRSCSQTTCATQKNIVNGLPPSSKDVRGL